MNQYPLSGVGGHRKSSKVSTTFAMITEIQSAQTRNKIQFHRPSIALIGGIALIGAHIIHLLNHMQDQQKNDDTSTKGKDSKAKCAKLIYLGLSNSCESVSNSFQVS